MIPKRTVFLCILVFALAAPATAGSVGRTVAPREGGLDITFTVTGIPIGGVFETLPDGCTWDRCDHPADRTRASGQQVAFAVVGEETIRCRVQGPQDVAEAFTGTWEDSLTGESGTVGASGPHELVPGETSKEAPDFLPAAALAVACRWRCGR